MAKKKIKPKNGKAKNISAIQIFRRTIHASRNFRQGLARARTLVDPINFPSIIKELSKNPIYQPILTPMTFPQTLSSIRSSGRLEEISLDGEIIWTSSVLSLYTEEINRFIKLRDIYYKEYETADYANASTTLDEIQRLFGFSIWLIESRIELLQITKGLEAQKTYLEEIISTEGINQFIAWIAYFFSVRSEENVSYVSFHSELSNVLDIPWISDYAILRFLPIDIAKISDLRMPISLEEAHPIIDRFETFVTIALINCTKSSESNKEVLLNALESIKSIKDARIIKIINILKRENISIENNFLKYSDAYSQGKYSAVLNQDTVGLELRARSYAHFDNFPPKNFGEGLRNQIVELMYKVMTLSPDASLSKIKLKKLAIICPNRSMSLEVAAFIERTHDNLRETNPSILDMLSALCMPLDNPWNASAIDGLLKENGWLNFLLEEFPESPSLKLRFALIERDLSALDDGDIKIPDYRRWMYLGHIYFNSNKFDMAAQFYGLAAASEIHFVAQNARYYLFRTHYADGSLHKAIQLLIDQVLSIPSAVFNYPLESLAREYLKYEGEKNKIDLAIILQLAIRYNNAKLERDLSNVFESIMDDSGYSSPAEYGNVSQEKKDKLTYFLRHICVPRILEDTTYFDGIEAIDQERIAICQHLLLIDKKNVSIYQNEIRSITRDSEIASLLSKVQTSKIYVDDAGIRATLEISLLEPLARYLKLLESPNLAYQAEKLSKRLVEMLKSKGHPEFKDLKLPATEREGLFNAILLEAGAEFALNAAYGLDTHVSTSIRHGAFEGHLRRPLVMEGLLCQKSNDNYVLPQMWNKKLPGFSSEELDALLKILSRFTQRFEELVNDYLKSKLHIKLVGDNLAMFGLAGTSEENKTLMESINPNTTVKDLSESLISHFWKQTIRSLDAIRYDLLHNATKQMTAAFDNFVKSVEDKFSHSVAMPLIDSVARARTSFQTAIEDVADWFQRPTDLTRSPFDIDIAVNVSLQQIANCYVGQAIHPSMNLSIDEKIDGRMLDGLCEIIFIFLQNTILHSGFSDQQSDVNISAQSLDGCLVIRCTNKFTTELSLEEIRLSASNAMSLYERDSALRMARKEGGSGLSKVWRIAEFDLRVGHHLEISVSDEREFIVSLSLDKVWA
ncbi:hypothetical protein [Delftia tsuruhatensis]|uniref:hypothetical protein n=1 Tax=Delftia tsuruhatensis TaxID=180282 RepID=UPI002091BDF5|nr:hypothetical protein [Delftia tsuruhatensis]MCO5337139.1 hypothetical protein [Delftia tsuruhatensis]MCR4548023.1 hypothetical protein [Delftia tsuruhatensis]